MKSKNKLKPMYAKQKNCKCKSAVAVAASSSIWKTNLLLSVANNWSTIALSTMVRAIKKLREKDISNQLTKQERIT